MGKKIGTSEGEKGGDGLWCMLVPRRCAKVIVGILVFCQVVT